MLVTDWDNFYFCTTPVNKLAAIVANQRNCGEQVTFDSRVLRLVVDLVDANNQVETLEPEVLLAIKGVLLPKKFKPQNMKHLALTRRRLIKAGREIDAQIVKIFMNCIKERTKMYMRVRDKQREIGVLNKVTGRKLVRVAKGKADAVY